MRTNSNYPRRLRFRGFSLVEIMVALVIGMIAMIIVLQIYGASEANKRTTTGADDAQMNGAVALFKLQQEITQAGYGFNSLNLFGCNLQLRSGVTLNVLAPVTINHASITGADANTDTLLVVYGSSENIPEGDRISTQPDTNIYAITSPAFFSVNDRVIALPSSRPSPCNLILDKVQTAAPSNSANVTMVTGVAGVANGRLFNFGSQPKVMAYKVHNGNLTQCDYMQNDCSQNNESFWVPIADNIASMRAQYGREESNVNSPMKGVVTTYDQTVQSPSTSPAVSSVQCGWARISAVRLALVARNSQFDKSNPTTVAPTWSGSSANSINLSGTSSYLPANTTWQGYRYKVYQTVVPLRNINWMGAQVGC